MATFQRRSTAPTPPSKTAKRFTFTPVGFDLFSPGTLAPPAGTIVVKSKAPRGCPPNGTMGHTYIADATTGAFLGLVLVNSLVPVGK